MPEGVDAATSKADAATIGNVAHGTTSTADAELDDFGLPLKEHKVSFPVEDKTDVASLGDDDPSTNVERNNEHTKTNGSNHGEEQEGSNYVTNGARGESPDSSDDEFKDAQSISNAEPQQSHEIRDPRESSASEHPVKEIQILETEGLPHSELPDAGTAILERPKAQKRERSTGPSRRSIGHRRDQSSKGQGISEWSHQQLASKQEEEEVAGEEDEWQTMPAYAPYDIYDDENKLVAREAKESDDEEDAYAGLGGAGKGYTRVQLDEDAQSATSLDENTQYLFKDVNGGGTGAGEMEDEEQRDAVSQMQATKDLLTEGQRIAYVGMTRLILSNMLDHADSLEATKGSRKETRIAAESMKMWSQKMMVRLYAHMDISTDEQIMIEQLAEHGVVPMDLTPTLMQNARVKNPMAENAPSTTSLSPPRPQSVASTDKSPRPSISSPSMLQTPQTPRRYDEEEPAQVPPPYREHEGDDLPEVRTPSQLPTTKNIDIDLRWTVLCDLFLTLIADSVYDSRSRVLLEKVGENMDVDWLEICRFEKRVTDALEMQQAAEKENWNEDEHKENRRKLALKKRYLMMGLATVGGSLVIGLSAGLLAPVIGAGLAAGFTTIGVAGTSGFLAGAGGAAIITSGAAASGGIIAVRAANRRTGAVKTFEYRPLHNNKRVNLIVTVSGWMTGKVDDVRLPYSTIDPIMGDIYSVLWEPDMLRSMGDTINILATEALTQGLQQVLGSTILIGLMAALQLPVVLTKLAYLIDNPWTVSLDRANAAGLILADSLIDRNLGTRPITFVGYSLGSRVIFSCLRELSKKGAYGLVQNVYLFGSPIVAKKDEYLKARSVVSGRFVNGYARNDWILGYLFRLTSGGISRVAGLAPIEEIPGLENVDVTDLVPGHMAYRTAMPRLLREVGWMVESDEFTEIEDPDPENHQQRQRELINEIEEARKEFEKKEKGTKGAFGFLSRKKKAAVEKRDWEMYEESRGTSEPGRATEDDSGNNHGVLFDIDAIRAELASEQMEVRELQSTLPPMKLDIGTSPNPRISLRETKSYDPTTLSNELKFSTPSFQKPDPGLTSSTPLCDGSAYEPEIEMTFDTSYHSPPLSATPSSNKLPLRPEPKFEASSSSWVPPQAEYTERAATLQRPEMKSSNTLPAMPIDHNAWADDDDIDEGFGREKEIEMTFA
ncbi:hypothetical protein B7494_g1165 [Chlorociboria aeruginascens]|nr:hypothetical protein B7494_g1165 [Chlorociboria aeruginascens]